MTIDPRVVGAAALALLLQGSLVRADIQSGIAALQTGNAEQAAKDFQAAFEAGDADGAFYLGRMFEMGLGAAPDMVRAGELYKVSADADSALGLNRLGLLYMDGQGVIRDYAQGADLMCKAAEKGLASAQFNCAAALTDGKGVEKDTTRAADLLQKASDQGHIASTNVLAMAYRDGAGVPVDAAKSLALFENTAQQGNSMGLFEVAKALDADPAGDKVKAYAYANIAAAGQHPDAPALRDRLEAVLTAAQVTEGQASARDFIARLTAEAAATTAPALTTDTPAPAAGN